MKKNEFDSKAPGSGNSTPGRQGTRNLDDRLKKIIICIFAGMTAFVIIGYSVARLVDFDALLSPSTEYKQPNTIIFATPNYDEDIFADDIYMGLDRNIYIYDIDTGLRESLEPDDYETYGDSVRFMSDFVNLIINGDADGYNSCFVSDEYHKESFTKQKLYNIVITKLSEEEITEAGQTWTEYEFALEYMIRHNNGTLRLDLESDACRAQYMTVSDRSGRLLIESMRFPVEQ